ncbi:MAG: ATP phosphoribosyltransferase regulatory subunit, partial [Clostridiales bacterium]|nr:ATP phosphoribosyltransferase regulatory subunit [Clostridiales bacterium]
EDMPIRLCYMGNTFANNSSYQGRLKEYTQLGAELLGDGTADADAEMLAMAVECLKVAGLKDFQISVGHADFFRGLMEAAGLREEQEEELRSLISNKNFFGVEEFVKTLHLNADLQLLFGLLGKLYGGSDELFEAEQAAGAYPRILRAIHRLKELHAILEEYEISRYITFELGIISHYEYYTGIIFAGYTFGSGEQIVKGGRYDELLTYFGKSSASIGFAFVIDQLMAALRRQQIEIPLEYHTLLIVYSQAGRREAIKISKEYRKLGRCVELMPKDASKQDSDYMDYANRNRIAEVRFL